MPQKQRRYPTPPAASRAEYTDEAGAPLENISVAIFRKTQRWQPQRTVWTNSSGGYKIPVLGAGTYRIQFVDLANRFETEYYADANQLEDAQDIIILGNDVTGIDAALAIGGSITGVLSVPPNRKVGHVNPTLVMMREDETWKLIDASFTITQAGPFGLGGLSAGTYRLCLSGQTLDLVGQNGAPFATCYNGQESLEEATPIIVAQGTPTADINMTIDGVAEVRGHVTATDSTGLPGISVALLAQEEGNWSPIRYSSTGPSGQYTMTALAPGTYTLTFQDYQQAYAPQFLGGSINISQALTIAVQAQETYTLAPEVLSSGAKISGNVRVLEEALLNHGTVTASRSGQDSWLDTNALRGEISPQTGEYVISGLLPGTYRLFAAGRLDIYSYSGFYGGPNPEDVISVTLEVGQSITGVDFSLGESLFESEISGIVSADDKPLPNIRVELDEQPDGRHIPVVYTTTDAQGHYSFPGLAPGSYCLHYIDPTGFYARSKNSPYEIGASCNRIDLMPQTVMTDVNKSLVRGGSISGNVRRFGGMPIAEVSVSVYTSVLGRWDKTALRTTTDDAGNYTILGVLPRPYRLLFEDTAGVYPSEYFGSPFEIDAAADVLVIAGENASKIDVVLGPDIDPTGPKLYLPLLMND